MTVTVKLFAAIRDATGTNDITVSLPAGATVAALRAAIARETPALTPLLGRSAISVNHEYAGEADVIVEGAEIAIIPPVSGG